MRDYEESYFAPRRHDEALRDAMRRQELERVCARTGLKGGKVVDIGCGLGEFLDLLPNSEQWTKYGVDVSEFARTTCLKKDISFDLPQGEAWCDLVLLRGSVQHLERPLDTLFEVHRWLRRGGWLVVLATPNAGSLSYRLFQDLPPLDPLLNFVVFSDRILRQCLINIGFREPEFYYPYLETPYASPLRDHFHFLLRLVGIKKQFAFWRNMMECYAQK